MTAKSILSQDGSQVLTINGGSSSIKFALFQKGDPPRRGLYGKIDRIGLPGTTLTFHDPAEKQSESQIIGDRDHATAARFLCDWLAERIGFDSIGAVGHRIVNGGARYYEPQSITSALLVELRRISAYAPEHLPAEIAMIDLFNERMPGLPQVACFDTAFHRNMPRLAHLGNGASLAAVREGKGIDTSMGFTPAAGVPMSTRSGDLDPGLAWYFAQTERMTAQQFHKMINLQSGLLGVSEHGSDLRDLLGRESGDIRATEAVALFCYQVKKWIGAFAAALGGVDTLVFAGGIGENSSVVRSRICEGLNFLGIQFDEMRNTAGEPVISADGSRVQVRVIRTDEDVVIVKAVFRILQETETSRHPASP